MTSRKTSNNSPRVWLGLLFALAVADFTLAKSARLERAEKPEEASRNYDTSYDYGADLLPQKAAPLLEEQSYLASKEETRRLNDSAEESTSKEETGEEDALIDATESSLEIATVKTEPKHSTIRENEQAMPTTTTIGSGKEPIEETVENGKEAGLIESLDVEEISNGSRHDADGGEKLPSIVANRRQEIEEEEERNDSEDHASSELAEATTPSPKFPENQTMNPFDSSHSSIERLDVGESDERSTISLANDTVVNHRVDSENDTGNFRRNSFGTTLSQEPKNQVEVFGDSGHPAVLRISEAVANDTEVGTTTPNFTAAKPRGRTIAISGDNEVVANQTTPETAARSFPKKSVSTEKPTVSKPYPYSKAENRVTSEEKIVTEMFNATDVTTEEISAYENTIGRRKTEDKIVVTEPSVLVENSIQQLKPVHEKRSGNSSRMNSTSGSPAATTVWSSVGPRNESETSDDESLDILSALGNRGQADNDVPQGNSMNISTSTEKAPTILSEVTENNIETVIGRTNANGSQTASSVATTEKTTDAVSGNDSELTEKMETVSVATTMNDGATNDREESRTTIRRFNVTDEGLTESHSVPEEGFSTSTEVYVASTSSVSEKATQEPLETTVSSPTRSSSTTEFARELTSEVPTTEERVVDATGTETNPSEGENTGSTTEATSSTELPTTVEYEFVGLSVSEKTTTSQGFVTSSEDANAVQTSPRTVETTETTVSEVGGFTEQNEATLSSGKVETTDPEAPSSITTVSFDESTTPDGGTIAEMTTPQDPENATSPSASEVSLTAGTTDVYPDTTASSTSATSDKTPAPRVDFTTSGGQSYNSEEITTERMATTTTVMTVTAPVTTEEATTVSNIEVIVSSESTTGFQSPVTVTQGTTVQIETTTDAPEFPVSTIDVTLFVTIIVEGSWSDVCPLLGTLRAALANLLTEGTDKIVLARNIILHQTQCSVETVANAAVTPILLYVVDDNGDFNYSMTEILPILYKQSPILFPLTIHSVEKLIQEDKSNNNAIAVIAVSSVAFICLVLLAGLLFIMRKRQTRFNYGERCRPVSLDSYRVDSVSAYNSVRRKDLARASKRSYGNPAFEDSSVTPTHPLNFAGLSSFCNDLNAITEEFSGIPQVSARIDELPAGAEVKNRYANVVPLPETRVPLQKINNEPLTEYINASYVRGPKNATKYYIACQAPIESTVADFWRMIWEQQSKVIIMLTDIIENGVEKCVDYIPPSEVTDCHRLYGDFQVTLKKHEAKEKYAISTLHLKNLENSTYREVSHIWYLWPTNGVPSDATGLIAILLEARALQRGAPGPIVVHCSPGTGRTGTLIALDLGIRQYEITRTVDVPRVVYTIRRDRAGAVQTKEQYAFIYKALNLYAAKLAGGALESM